MLSIWIREDSKTLGVETCEQCSGLFALVFLSGVCFLTCHKGKQFAASATESTSWYHLGGSKQQVLQHHSLC